MDTKINLNSRFKTACYLLIIIGLITFSYGFFKNPGQTWANLLLNNYYFLSLAIGATFFMALQYITQSGWSAMFKRVPEAMGFFIPVAAVFMLLTYFGVSHLYEWTHKDAIQTDEAVIHKLPYLNLPFFFIRIVVYFSLWILMTTLLRKLSHKEDLVGGISWFERSEFYSKVYIFILAITFSLASFDWIMSLDVHWLSTLFAVKNFVTAFYHGTAVITLIVILLHEKGCYKELNSSHLLDFSRYLFMLSIIWGYLWFSQFMLIWYSNLPEETIYYARQIREGYRVLFFVNVFINWFIPFILLLARRMDQKIMVVKWICIILIFGQWIDMYTQVFPGTVGKSSFSLLEIGCFLGFAGLFALVTGWGLTRASLVPKNHPYLDESLYHHVE
ncbi:MAG: quinol:cytochrome C oxidoreductase [Bacteroidetes bacterium]|nr:quinol:cytochrome C oxidoreductase [Bacteroidota bacterium]